MFTTKLTLLGALLALVLAGPPAGRAEVRGLALGEAGLPTMVGGFKLMRFNRDARPIFTVLTAVPSPTGGELTFTEPQILNYAFPACQRGFIVDRYRPLQVPGSQIIMELPARTRAFYFETAHGLGSYYHISALVDEDLDTLRQQGVNGGFACGTFAYWLDSPHDPPMRQIRVNLMGLGTMAVGEFAIYVPPDLPGDMNCDARVNFDDIAGFVLAAIGEAAFLEVYPGCIYSNADMNGDGLINFDDIDGFVLRLARG